MRRFALSVGLVILLAGVACDSGETETLEKELETARSQLAAAEKAAKASEEEAERSERDRKRMARELRRFQEQAGVVERPGEGVVLTVPLVGSLTWRCNDDRHFSFSFVPQMATVEVQQSIDGELTRKTLHPGQRLTSAFRPADVHREWTVTYRHKPGTISVGISVVPSISGGMCFIRNSTLEQNRTPSY